MEHHEPRDRTDAQLLAAAGREPSAFAELYRRHVPRVYAWHARRLEWAAADLTAETFARAWTAPEGVPRPARRLGAAVAPRHRAQRAARVRATEGIESRARERLGLPLDLADEDGYAAVEERLSPSRAMAAALDGLPDHERDAVDLRVIEELPYAEVGRRLGIRPAAARLRVSRALRRLASIDPKEEM
jgi:RNA polymerase sigma factor (sigma-70 family)